MAGVTLSVNPVNSGEIYCDKKKMNNYAIYDIGTELSCEAKTNKTASLVPLVGDWLESITKGDLVFDSWSGLSNKSSTSTTFKVSQFGVLSANFKQSPPLLPDWLLGVIATLVVSGVIATYKILIKKTHRVNTKEYEKKIESTYALYHNKEECLHRLSERRRQITELFVNGKISKRNYELLDNKISDYENDMLKKAKS
jgi:hypothetical protein